MAWQRGRDLARRYSRPFQIDGRPITNTEMRDLLEWSEFLLSSGFFRKTGEDVDVSDYISGGQYLKAEDLKGRKVTVVMSKVERTEFTRDDGTLEPKLVIAFDGKEKALVCNKLNARVIAAQFGTNTDEWVGKEIRLYPAKVDFRGQMVDAIRVEIPMPEAPGDIPF